MISSLIRKDLSGFIPYQIAQIRRDVLRMHANESPWSLCEGDLNRYPIQMNLEKVAQYYRVSPEKIVVTRGSNEGIDLLVRLFCEAGVDEMLTLSPTYGLYELAAQLQGVRVNTVSLEPNDDFTFNMDRIIAALTPNTKIVFLCSPNNPTGNSLDYDSLRRLCEYTNSRCVIVVDEAYIEFSDQDSAVGLTNEYPNLVILRTLSKAFGMAGLRVGIVIGDQSLIQCLQSIIPPYPIPTPCQIFLESAMSNEKIVQMWINISMLKKSRLIMRNKLSSLSCIERVYPSDANFFLIKINDAEALANYFLQRGVLIRRVGKTNSLLRISLGSAEDNNKVISIFMEWENKYEK